jgi:RNA polymerase sigma-70 factor (ECF subfamily)
MMSIKWNERFKNKEKKFVKMLDLDKEQFYRIAFSYLKNEHDALDVLQDSIGMAYEKLSDLREIAYMKTWFVRILINRSISMCKQKSRWLPNDYIEDLQTDYRLDQETENKIDVMTSLERLDAREKTIVILRYFEDFKLEDVAHTIDLPLSTTKTILYRALKKMKVSLEEVSFDE